MASRWKLEETISARRVKAKSAGLAKRVERVIGKMALCDSVQLWRDSNSGKTEPFVLFSLQQLAALKSFELSPTSVRRAPNAVAVEVVQRTSKTIALSEVTSTLQRRLIERLIQDIPELSVCSSFAFERTRTKAVDVPKWVATLIVEGRRVLVGSLTPARDLIKGGDSKLKFVGETDGMKLVGTRTDAVGHLIGRLVDLGLYTDDVARALAQARANPTVANTHGI